MPYTILFIRHGEADDSQNLWGGDSPGPDLTVDGREQARTLGESLREAGIRMLWTGPQIRAWRTAAIIREIINVLPTRMEDLREI